MARTSSCASNVPPVRAAVISAAASQRPGSRGVCCLRSTSRKSDSLSHVGDREGDGSGASRFDVAISGHGRRLPAECATAENQRRRETKRSGIATFMDWRNGQNADFAQFTTDFREELRRNRSCKGSGSWGASRHEIFDGVDNGDCVASGDWRNGTCRSDGSTRARPHGTMGDHAPGPGDQHAKHVEAKRR